MTSPATGPEAAFIGHFIERDEIIGSQFRRLPVNASRWHAMDRTLGRTSCGYRHSRRRPAPSLEQDPSERTLPAVCESGRFRAPIDDERKPSGSDFQARPSG